MTNKKQYGFYRDGLAIKKNLLNAVRLSAVREECDDAMIKQWKQGYDIEKDYGCILDGPVPAGEYTFECYKGLRLKYGLLHPLIIDEVAKQVKETLNITQQLYFLNEQYICKPSNSIGTAFK